MFGLEPMLSLWGRKYMAYDTGKWQQVVVPLWQMIVDHSGSELNATGRSDIPILLPVNTKGNTIYASYQSSDWVSQWPRPHASIKSENPSAAFLASSFRNALDHPCHLYMCLRCWMSKSVFHCFALERTSSTLSCRSARLGLYPLRLWGFPATNELQVPIIRFQVLEDSFDIMWFKLMVSNPVLSHLAVLHIQWTLNVTAFVILDVWAATILWWSKR